LYEFETEGLTKWAIRNLLIPKETTDDACSARYSTVEKEKAAEGLPRYGIHRFTWKLL